MHEHPKAPLRVAASWRLEPDEGVYATEPSIARCPSSGDLWVSWTQRAPDGSEAIWARALRDRAPVDAPVRLSRQDTQGAAAWSALTAHAGGVFAAWVERVAAPSAEALPTARLWLADVRAPSQARIVRQCDALRHLTLHATSDGALWLAYTRTEDGEHAVEVLRVDGQAALQRAVLDPSRVALRARPALAAQPGTGDAWVVWEAHGRGASRLRAARVPRGLDEGARVSAVDLPPRGCFHQAPALAFNPDQPEGAWLAWNHDGRLGASADLARRVQVAWLSLSEEGAPAAWRLVGDMPGVDLDARGEDQSLEFAALAHPSGDGLWAIARASHNFRAARLAQNADGLAWTPALDLTDVLWGCRGIRISAVAAAAGCVAVVCHDRKGVEVRWLEADPSAPPTPPAAESAPASPWPDAAPAAPAPPERAAWTLGSDTPLRVYWGDLHMHSARSDGVGTLEEAYLRARDRYGDDFCCVTDHDGFIRRRVTESVWRDMVDLADAFNAPSRDAFATLVGIEFTGPRYPGPGHKCVYLPHGRDPVICRWDGDLSDPAALLRHVEASGGFAIPHHVGWLGGDPEHHREAVQPCWEICSTHGQYEAERDAPDAPPIDYRDGLPQHIEALRDHFIRPQLEAGARFGFVGGSDGHGLLWHHGVGRNRDSHRTGLTGVWLAQLSRPAILDALRARRTFATSGPRMTLAHAIDGHPMGATLPQAPTPGASVEVIAHAAGAPIEALELLALTDAGIRVVHRVEDARGLDAWRGEVPLPEAATTSARGVVYTRLIRADGEVAWASPCFWGDV